jgi:hypothetical protein
MNSGYLTRIHGWEPQLRSTALALESHLHSWCASRGPFSRCCCCTHLRSYLLLHDSCDVVLAHALCQGAVLPTDFPTVFCWSCLRLE